MKQKREKKKKKHAEDIGVSTAWKNENFLKLVWRQAKITFLLTSVFTKLCKILLASKYSG